MNIGFFLVLVLGFCSLVGFCLFLFVVFSFKRAWKVPKYDRVLLLSCRERQNLKRSVGKPAHWMFCAELGFYLIPVSEFHLHSRQWLWGGVSDRAITAGSTSILVHQNCKKINFFYNLYLQSYCVTWDQPRKEDH